MMRRICVYIITLIFAILCVGCSQYADTETEVPYVDIEGYKVIEDGGNYYIHLENAVSHPYSDMCDRVIRYMMFDSVAEMVDDIKGGKFTQLESLLLQDNFPKDEEGRIPLFDMSDLYEPHLPAIFSYYAIWYGPSYGYGIYRKGITGVSGFRFINEQAFQEGASMLESIKEDESITILNQETDSEIWDVILEYENARGNRFKYGFYHLITEERAVYVQAQLLDDGTICAFESWNYELGEYYKIRLALCEPAIDTNKLLPGETFTLEDILQFGIHPYNG